MHLLYSVATAMLKAARNKNSEGALVDTQEKDLKNVAVLPYIHAIAHNLKMARKRAGLNVAFSAPWKLICLCSKVNTKDKIRRDCGLRLQTPKIRKMCKRTA